MLPRSIANLMPIATLVAAAYLAPAALGVNESEPNGQFSNANGPFTESAVIQGVFSSSGDYDVFRVDLTETRALRVSVWSGAPGECVSVNFNFDPMIEVLTSSGQTVVTMDDTNNLLCPVADGENTPALRSMAPGTYYVRCRNLPPSTNVPYVLYIDIDPAFEALSNSFTYQGVLNEAGGPFTGHKQITASVWKHDAVTDTRFRLSLPLLFSAVEVNKGLFTLPLDFATPDMFNGEARWLQIEVADVGGTNSVTLPRVKMLAAPHAAFALKAKAAAEADHATNATNATYAQQSVTAGEAHSALFAFEAAGWEIASGLITTTDRQIGINTANPGAFNLAVNGTAAKTGGGAWAVFCDSRLKHDIEPLTGTLDRLLKLRGYTFTYNDEAVEKRLALPGQQVGLIAEEVERIFPDWVEKDGEGYRYVTERSTTALMVEALRDLRQEKDRAIESLSNENRDLRERLERLERAIESK